MLTLVYIFNTLDFIFNPSFLHWSKIRSAFSTFFLCFVRSLFVKDKYSNFNNLTESLLMINNGTRHTFNQSVTKDTNVYLFQYTQVGFDIWVQRRPVLQHLIFLAIRFTYKLGPQTYCRDYFSKPYPGKLTAHRYSICLSIENVQICFDGLIFGLFWVYLALFSFEGTFFLTKKTKVNNTKSLKPKTSSCGPEVVDLYTPHQLQHLCDHTQW